MLGLVTVCGQVNHLGMWSATYIDSAFFTGLLVAYRQASGSGRLAWSKGQRPLALFLQSPCEPGELWQCCKYDDSNISIVQVLLVLICLEK